MQVRERVVFEKNALDILNNLAWDVLGVFVKKLVPPAERSQFYLNERTAGASKLYNALMLLKDHMPQKRMINVASFNSPTPDDLLALRAHYDVYFPEGAPVINFFNFACSEEIQVANREIFRNFPQFRFISCQLDKDAMVAALRQFDCLKQGFDLVILRQVEFINSVYSYTNQKMLQEIIPFVAAKEAQVIFTFDYRHKESMRVLHTVMDSKHYINSKKSNLALNYEEDSLKPQPDSFCIICGVKGLAFEQRLNPIRVAQYSVLSNEAGKHRQELIANIHQINIDCDLSQADMTLINRHVQEGNYNVALRLACQRLWVEHIKELLKHKDGLKLDVNEASPSSNKTPLDWVDLAESPAVGARKGMALAALLNAGAITRNVSKITRLPNS